MVGGQAGGLPARLGHAELERAARASSGLSAASRSRRSRPADRLAPPPPASPAPPGSWRSTRGVSAKADRSTAGPGAARRSSRASRRPAAGPRSGVGSGAAATSMPLPASTVSRLARWATAMASTVSVDALAADLRLGGHPGVADLLERRGDLGRRGHAQGDAARAPARSRDDTTVTGATTVTRRPQPRRPAATAAPPAPGPRCGACGTCAQTASRCAPQRSWRQPRNTA